jgi:hypothetical protein
MVINIIITSNMILIQTIIIIIKTAGIIVIVIELQSRSSRPAIIILFNSLWLASSLLLHWPHPKSPSWGNFGEFVRIVHSSVTWHNIICQIIF